MRKRKIIAGVLVLAAATLVVIICLLPPRDPVYAGEPLSHWLKGYDPIEGSEPGRQKADEIMREAGTNAIPTLLRMLRERDSPWKLKLIALARKQHVITIWHVEDYRRHDRAASAFAALGSEGKVALPELVEIYEMNLSRSSQAFILSIIGNIGPQATQAIPLLVRRAANTNVDSRIFCVHALGQIHAEPRVVVPALMGLLNDPDIAIRENAAWALGEYGLEAKEAVPALIEAFENQDRFANRHASVALQQIDPETAARVIAENQQALK